MKETELRIGNLIFFNDDNNTICAIESIKRDFDDEPYSVEIKFKDGMFSDVNIEDIKPIPLTEEWLLKFGFEKSTKNSFAKWSSEGKKVTISHRENKFEEFLHIVELKYVHQLQNLYYALTGNELITKSKAPVSA